MADAPAEIHSKFISREFWTNEFPELSIEARPLPSYWLEALGQTRPDGPRDHARMVEDGYFQGHSAMLDVLAPKLGAAVRKLHSLDIPPPFLFLFDETWAAFAALAPWLIPHLNEMRMLPDFWVWHVDPQAGESGWAPHVDKGRSALDEQGRPLSLTVWVPLSRATPLNGCMYMLPASADPEYGVSGKNRTKSLPLPKVRALPVDPGDFLVWNQAVFHWGSASSRFAEDARMSMALEFQRGDIDPFNKPLIALDYDLSFAQRLWLVGKQIIQYQHMYKLRPEFAALAKALLTR